MEVVDRTRDRVRADCYRTLIGLLASTGLRVGEAIALDRSDLDSEEGILTVRHGKFGKSRQLPLHVTTLHALEEYASRRNHRFRRSFDSPLLLSNAGTRLRYRNFQFTFFHLVEWAGLADRSPRRPRIHDLRHTFAVRTLIDWYRAGLDVERQLPILSTYLGHVDPKHTYRYLSSVPELLGVATQRFERSMGGSQ
jgi:integrase